MSPFHANVFVPFKNRGLYKEWYKKNLVTDGKLFVFLSLFYGHFVLVFLAIVPKTNTKEIVIKG